MDNQAAAIDKKKLQNAHNNGALRGASQQQKKRRIGKVVDGFVRKKKIQQAQNLPHINAQTVARSTIAAGDVHAGAGKSVTLNRRALQKPQPRPKAHAKSMPAIQTMNDTVPHNRQQVGKPSPVRTQRALQTHRSSVISKFANNHKISNETVVAPTMTQKISPPAQAQKNAKEDLIASAMASLNSATPVVSTQAKKRPLDNIRQKFNNRTSTFNKVATSASILLAVGYGVYLNIPNIALRVAASRAGFEANMPGYHPAGFSFTGPISYAPGQITIEYSSNVDGREFTVVQRETNWDSQSLLDNHIAMNNQLYQTFQERGLTIYVYEDSKASWVNGGIWYTIEGDSNLNTEQLIKIASSL